MQKTIQCLTIIIISAILSSQIHAEQAVGPLKVSQENPRYFTDGSGKAVYLTGSHVWYNLVDMGPFNPPKPFDYDKYLDWMAELNHNCFRLWAWEMTQWDTSQNSQPNASTIHYINIHPWPRNVRALALDGKPQFDLSQWNDHYFNRLRYRVKLAGDKGIYAAIMLFEGWCMQFAPNGWDNHPFNAKNNNSNIDGDLDKDGNGLEIYTLTNPRITKLQEDYVKKVIDTVNDLDNVLYEISNENHPPSTAWQYHIINLIQEYQKTKPQQHPVGMTFQYKGGKNETLFNSKADWISPNNEGGYRDEPPANDGKKVILNDTDHLWGIGGNQAWVWKSFLRGHNTLFMDPYDAVVLGETPFDPKYESIRKSLGYTRTFANRMNLIGMKPMNNLASTGYCLANPGKEYLVYLPEGKPVTVQFTETERTYTVEWFNPNDGKTNKSSSITVKGRQVFQPPFDGVDCVLYVKEHNS